MELITNGPLPHTGAIALSVHAGARVFAAQAGAHVLPFFVYDSQVIDQSSFVTSLPKTVFVVDFCDKSAI